MYTHKVLKNWEYYQDSVQSLFINNNFNRMLTGSKSGEIYLTDLPRSCYCKIEKVGQPITSLAMNSNSDILASTADSKLYEYVS
jgi:hypothetical protein